MSSLYRLKRHPFEIEANLHRSFVLAYAVPSEALAPLLKPGLALDNFGDFGFMAVAMVQTENLRLAGLPKAMGKSFFLTGYRLFVRYRTKAGRNLRGLQILRSQADSSLMVHAGSLLSHYAYEKVSVDLQSEDAHLSVIVRRRGETILDVDADLLKASLPESSVFKTEAEARRFEGPMPFTFDYEEETNSILRVQGVREEWQPRLVSATVNVPPPFAEFGIDPSLPRLASSFLLTEVPYRWKKGVIESLVRSL